MSAPDRELFLDVSHLEPPEPLVRALAEAERLGPGQYMRMLHRREPCLLYPNLDKRGFSHLTRSSAGGRFEVFIWNRGDDAARRAVLTAAGELAGG